MSGLIRFALSLLASSPVSAEPAYRALYTQCLLHAADPKNPWALAHGITALGKSFAAQDGRKASDVIISDFLKRGGPAEGNPYSFDRYGPDGTPIEPHTNLQVKTLVLAGVPLSTKFKASFGEVALGQLVEGVKRGFRHVPSSEEYWRDVAWTLDLLAATLDEKRATFVNGAGEKVDFGAVMDDALAYLEKAQAEIADGMDKSLPEVPKRKQGIYAHTCGGLHLFQAVASWARHKAVKQRWGERLDRQISVLFYRLGSESRQYERALEQAPQYKLKLFTQMVKFYGHFLETTGRLKAEIGFRPTEAQKRDIAKAKALLDDAVRNLQELKAFESMDQLAKTERQVYLDLIGDSCHAVNGWRYWK